MQKKVNLGFVFLAIPILVYIYACNYLNNNNQDIWFILKHGEYVLNNGFPNIEFLTIHHNLNFVMQQWLFSLITYLIYSHMGIIGLVIMIGFLNLALIYFMYKLCLFLSNNKYLAYLVTTFLDTCLILFFITIRPLVFSLLLLLIINYILERKDKTIYFMPFLSLLLVNCHASMWPLLFIICLPYLVEYIIKKDKRILILLIMMIISFFIGFLNPYGLEGMFYSASAYGIKSINLLVNEMHPFSFTGKVMAQRYSVIFLALFILLAIVMIKNYKKITIHSLLLILGFAFMSYLNIRNISLFIVCAMPYLSILTVKGEAYSISIKYVIIIIILISVLFHYKINNNDYQLDNRMRKVADYLDQNYTKDKVILYNEYDDGAYLEFRGYKAYIDVRAEVFVKKLNHKEDILDEYIYSTTGNINYQKFINKYQFTHLIVYNQTPIYEYLKESSNYKKEYKINKDLYIFSKQ